LQVEFAVEFAKLKQILYAPQFRTKIQ
jgi:hypothetical protein